MCSKLLLRPIICHHANVAHGNFQSILLMTLLQFMTGPHLDASVFRRREPGGAAASRVSGRRTVIAVRTGMGRNLHTPLGAAFYQEPADGGYWVSCKVAPPGTNLSHWRFADWDRRDNDMGHARVANRSHLAGAHLMQREARRKALEEAVHILDNAVAPEHAPRTVSAQGTVSTGSRDLGIVAPGVDAGRVPGPVTHPRDGSIHAENVTSASRIGHWKQQGTRSEGKRERVVAIADAEDHFRVSLHDVVLVLLSPLDHVVHCLGNRGGPDVGTCGSRQTKNGERCGGICPLKKLVPKGEGAVGGPDVGTCGSRQTKNGERCGGICPLKKLVPKGEGNKFATEFCSGFVIARIVGVCEFWEYDG
ncbi:hypothetical protein DFJ77DRAFT_518731 [Powellomyces hirtus]|nr:hypothetical protein DFJ77DRAFT_518731 [Powellomyces hirtus]